ncbi:hypothetical protein M407DRAFT_34782 [Tulasnella calospora MUT 4182]|uniref:C3H1-type domain-containing protein n=1 Tax=Tulasnella calospora MUT 4182 TaxID=1051891 RepID=A0A0C3L1N2_9AGAM|nr:hypothetical protein M407DRAFT_34782 [Tulasnella calospora MUT 4182]
MPPKQRRLCDFHQRGHCRLGDSCKFLHASVDEHTSPPQTPKTPRTPKPQSFAAANQTPATPSSRRQSAPPPTTPATPANRFVADLPRNTCRSFWDTGKCDRGHSCKFQHISRSQSSQPQSTPQPAPPAANRFVADLPRNTCRTYWETGKCDRGYDCKFEHKSRPQPSQPKSISRTAPLVLGALIEEYLDRYVSGFSDGFALNSFNPGQVHNKLKPFVQDGSEFRTSQETYHFASILDSVHEYNDEWDYDNGQSFLMTVSDPSKEGILRIQDILLHESVSSEAVNPDDLSFQRAYLPVLGYISSRWVLRSTLRRNINALYGLLHHSFEEIDRVLQSCIGSCMERKSFSDSSASVSGLRVFSTVAKCLFE